MAMIPSGFIKHIISSFEDLINNKTIKILGLTSETKKLVDKLDKISHVLENAERKKSNNSEVNRWLEELKDVLYEYDEIIDYCIIEGHQSNKEHQKQVSTGPRLLASCFDQSNARDEITNSIKQLNKKLKAILKEISRLKLEHVVRKNTKNVPSDTLSQIQPSDIIVGVHIENDSNDLVTILISGETDGINGEGSNLVAIVGIGGIGKSTLAKRIFDDERIKGSFDTRIWISLSSGLKDIPLLLKIIEALGGKPKKSLTRARLMSKLAKLITRKKYLIVLDDISDSTIWESLLKTPLKKGMNGSRILVTARDENIPIRMGALYIHNADKLSVEDGWKLLCKSAFLEEENESEILRDIGMQIVEKCDGLPLGIKVIGSVLRRKEATINEWLGVCENQTWSTQTQGLNEEILNALYLGYEELTSNLKQCFLYCSLFTKDYVIDRRDVIQQWIGEGFIEKRDGYTLEEIGNEYITELVERYFIQPEFEFEDIEKFKMHDLVVSMGQSLSMDESFFGDLENIQDVTLKTRNISFVSKGIETIPNEIKSKEKVRALVLSMNPLKDDELRDLFMRLKQLRVLDLSETLIEEIPDSLQHSVHLRYLNLSRTMIKEIPKSILHLQLLEFLVLQECKRLHILPKGIEHLSGLKTLDFSGTTIYQFLFGIGKLVSLNSLHFFIANTKSGREQNKNGWPLSEIKNLTKLRSLHILQLDKAQDRNEAKEGKLGTITHLKELELSCSDEVTPLENPLIIQKIELIFKELCPPPSLETLKIKNYFGADYPYWLSTNYLPILNRIELISCQFCESIPPLGQLPQLKLFYITDCSNIKEFGSNVIGSEQEPTFPKLEKLHIQSMQKLGSWIGLDTGSLPCLKVFQIESCPEIRNFPSSIRHCKDLKELKVLDCESIESIENFIAVKELSVWNIPKLRMISNIPLLEDLSISHCPNLEIVKQVDSLKSLDIFDYDLEQIPKWVGFHTSKIYSLNLTGKVEMLKKCFINGPNWNIIEDINRVYGYSNSSTFFLYQKNPFSFETNLSIPSVSAPLEKENSSTIETMVIEPIIEETQETNINEIVNIKIEEINMSEKIVNDYDYDSDRSGTSNVNLIRRPRRSKRREFEPNGDPNLVMKETLNSRIETPSHESSEKKTSENGDDSFSPNLNLNLCLDSRNDDSISEENLASENNANDSFSMELNPIRIINVFSNEEILDDDNGTLFSRIETVSHQSTENEASENEGSNLDLSFETELREIENSFDSIFEPITYEGMDEEANLVFATVEEITDITLDPLVELQETQNTEEEDGEQKDELIDQSIANIEMVNLVENISSSEEVNRSKNEKLKDYLIVILLVVSVTQLCFIFWLVLWFVRK